MNINNRVGEKSDIIGLFVLGFGLTDFIISERRIQTGTADYLLITKENNANLLR